LIIDYSSAQLLSYDIITGSHCWDLTDKLQYKTKIMHRHILLTTKRELFLLEEGSK